MGGKHSYGVILDAGSSGTRVYVYSWLKAAQARAKGKTKELQRLPEIKTDKDWRKKIHPGVSTFGDHPEEVGHEHLKPLVDFALDIVPKDEVRDTPIFLLATAGMRLLPAHQRVAVLQNICAYFRENTAFQLPDCELHVQVIPGETEGLYGWIAANYLLGGFDAPEEHDHGKGHHTYGFLDMGGASAQIAFAPNATEAEKHAEDLKLLRLRKVNGDALEYKVFVTTWLGFGANEARRRYLQHLYDAYSSLEIPDPCLPPGLTMDKTGTEIWSGDAGTHGKETELVGTGDFTECLRRTYPLLEKDKPCEDTPCLLNGVHTPAIDFDVNHFVGVSEYWHTTHELFAMAHKDKAYDFHTYQKQVTELCSREWTSIIEDVKQNKWGKKVDEKTVAEVCFKASWLINMLHDGIGVPRVGLENINQPGSGLSNKTNAVLDSAKDRGFLDPFQAVDKIDGTEVSWTLGKMVLYASSQMPAEAGALAVGFGSNQPGILLPTDFQFAGAKPSPVMSNTTEDNATTSEWHDRLLDSSYSQRVPGILIFLLIVALVVYFLCGRERRLAFQHRISNLLGRRPGASSSSYSHLPSSRRGKKAPKFLSGANIFGTGTSDRNAGGPSYERLSNEDIADDLDDVELGGMAPHQAHYSDSTNDAHSSPARTGRTSGWATPSNSQQNRTLSPDYSRVSPKTPVPVSVTTSSTSGRTGFNTGYFDNHQFTSVNTSSSNLVGMMAAGSNSTTPKASVSGLGITPFERGGLSVRTESRERLNAMGKSRTASPARKSPLVVPSFKESLD